MRAARRKQQQRIQETIRASLKAPGMGVLGGFRIASREGAQHSLDAMPVLRHQCNQARALSEGITHHNDEALPQSIPWERVVGVGPCSPILAETARTSENTRRFIMTIGTDGRVCVERRQLLKA